MTPAGAYLCDNVVVWNTKIDDLITWTPDEVSAPSKGSTVGIRRSNFPSGVTSTARFTAPIRIGSLGDAVVFVLWMPSNTNTGSVRWRMRYQAVEFGQVASGVFESTNVVQSSPGVMNQLSSQTFMISAAAIPTSGAISIDVQRRGTHSQDTYVGTARVVGFGFRRDRIPNKVPPL